MHQPDPPVSLSVSRRDSGLLIVAIQGELDTLATRLIEPAFSVALSDRTAHALVDLHQVPLITSAALAMFVMRARALHLGGGNLRFAGATPPVQLVFDLGGFSQVLPVYATLDEGIAAMERELLP
ncbi:MAG: hypothetical protein Kow00124_32120 [Anaerolineae bacterium]